VNFDAVQQAPAASRDSGGTRGGDVVLMPTATPRGLFRAGTGQ
jgi:hypothetical protein